MIKGNRLRAGERMVLVAIPTGLLDGLPEEDQRAIEAIVGKPVTFLGYDDIGRAELEFDDPFDDPIHTIWVRPEFIQRRRNRRSRRQSRWRVSRLAVADRLRTELGLTPSRRGRLGTSMPPGDGAAIVRVSWRRSRRASKRPNG